MYVVIIFMIDSLQKHNEKLPSGAFRDFDYENHNEIQLPSDAFRDFFIIFLIDSLQKHNEKLPSRAFRDYPPERSGG